MKELKQKTFGELLAKYAERAGWTALQAFFAMVIVDDGFSGAAVATGAVAAGLAVLKNVVLPLAAKRLAKLNEETA